MTRWEKTIKTQKMVENIENCFNHICKGSNKMFARQLDTCLYIVNKVVKQGSKMTKIWAEGITLIMDLKCKLKPE